MSVANHLLQVKMLQYSILDSFNVFFLRNDAFLTPRSCHCQKKYVYATPLANILQWLHFLCVGCKLNVEKLNVENT